MSGSGEREAEMTAAATNPDPHDELTHPRAPAAGTEKPAGHSIGAGLGAVGPLPPPRMPPTFPAASQGGPPKVIVVAEEGSDGSGENRSGQVSVPPAGIELGRPIFAVAAIGALLTTGAILLVGRTAGQGVAIGAVVATANLWAFTRLGAAFLARRGVQTAFALLAVLKLVVLFGAVVIVLKAELAGPVPFLIGYLALPAGIVVSQLLGLRHDLENGEGSV